MWSKQMGRIKAFGPFLLAQKEPMEKEKSQRLMHQFRQEIKKLIGKLLFDLPPEEGLAGVKKAVEEDLIDYFSRRPPLEFEVESDPEDPSKAIVTITAKTKAGEDMLRKYMKEHNLGQYKKG